jgi:hypothetical protein
MIKIHPNLQKLRGKLGIREKFILGSAGIRTPEGQYVRQ